MRCTPRNTENTKRLSKNLIQEIFPLNTWGLGSPDTQERTSKKLLFISTLSNKNQPGLCKPDLKKANSL